MPALRIRARAVVEDHVALRPPTTPQPIRVDRPKLQDHPARQPGHQAGVGPLEALAKLAIGDLQLGLGSAGCSQRGKTRGVTLKPPTVQQAIDEVDDELMQFSQAGEIRFRNLGCLQCSGRAVGCSQRLGMNLRTRHGSSCRSVKRAIASRTRSTAQRLVGRSPTSSEDAGISAPRRSSPQTLSSATRRWSIERMVASPRSDSLTSRPAVRRRYRRMRWGGRSSGERSRGVLGPVRPAGAEGVDQA